MKNSAKKASQPYWKRNSSLNFSIGLVLSLTMVITAFEWNFKSPLTENPIVLPSEAIDIPEFVVTQIPSPPKPKIPPVSHEVEEATTPPLATTEPVPDPPIDLPAGDGPEPDFSDALAGMEPGKEATSEAKYELIPAEPVGGHEAFYEYLYSKIHYPAHLANRNAAGKVKVKFDIDEKGRITNVRILEGFDKTLEKEITRVLKEAPAWKPAKFGAENIKTSRTIPFSFDLK